uniref:Uncharacterized protein n=1 Tax=Anguilla anguilla TaxID=7936 RepID=A0A0E9XPD2_ANGAN
MMTFQDSFGLLCPVGKKFAIAVQLKVPH